MKLFYQNLDIRLKYFIYCSLIILILISSYLFHLQVNLKLKFLNLGQKNFLRYEKVNSPRGNIVDCQNKLIAANKPVYTVYWKGSGKKQLTVDQIGYIKALSKIINISQDKIDQIIESEKKSKKICLFHDVNFEHISKLLEEIPVNSNIIPNIIPNIIIETEFKRFYPNKSIASHVIGYLGFDLNSHGKMGLELVCEDMLKGKNGEIAKIINSTGSIISYYETQKADSGGIVKTTLNLDLQIIAEKLFPKNYDGTCILLDPVTGAIEILLSYPNFDPNIFISSIDYGKWQDLTSRKCFINRAFNASYPPASLFKLVTIAAALETELIKPDTHWYCSGYTKYGDRLYHCARAGGHGKVNCEKALAYSCNIPFYEIAQKIKIDTLAKYARYLGLGSKTNIILGESAGLIPTREWKIRTKNEPWWPGETLSASIGQSFLLATPIQLACMISAICTGKLVKPKILFNEQTIKNKIKINKSTLQLLKKSMKTTVLLGTAKRLNSLENFVIHAKTGTAQTQNLKRKKLEKQHLSHAWFVAFFKYKNYPPKTLAILLEHAGRASIAMSTAEAFFKEYANYLDSKI